MMIIEGNHPQIGLFQLFSDGDLSEFKQILSFCITSCYFGGEVAILFPCGYGMRFVSPLLPPAASRFGQPALQPGCAPLQAMFDSGGVHMYLVSIYCLFGDDTGKKN